jgi:transposase
MLSLNRGERVSLLIAFGERHRQRIKKALRGEWKFTTMEMVKRSSGWYAHFVLKKVVEVVDKPETIIAVDMSEPDLLPP